MNLRRHWSWMIFCWLFLLVSQFSTLMACLCLNLVCWFAKLEITKQSSILHVPQAFTILPLIFRLICSVLTASRTDFACLWGNAYCHFDYVRYAFTCLYSTFLYIKIHMIFSKTSSPYSFLFLFMITGCLQKILGHDRPRVIIRILMN